MKAFMFRLMNVLDNNSHKFSDFTATCTKSTLTLTIIYDGDTSVALTGLSVVTWNTDDTMDFDLFVSMVEETINTNFENGERVARELHNGVSEQKA